VPHRHSCAENLSGLNTMAAFSVDLALYTPLPVLSAVGISNSWRTGISNVTRTARQIAFAAILTVVGSWLQCGVAG
jgi:hypothetical protein